MYDRRAFHYVEIDILIERYLLCLVFRTRLVTALSNEHEHRIMKDDREILIKAVSVIRATRRRNCSIQKKEGCVILTIALANRFAADTIIGGRRGKKEI